LNTKKDVIRGSLFAGEQDSSTKERFNSENGPADTEGTTKKATHRAGLSHLEFSSMVRLGFANRAINQD
jgi:hypothetical protein